MAFLLDTDHLVILQQRSRPAFDNLTARLAKANPDDIFASIISFHEQMQGWLTFLNRSRSPSQIVMAYTELDEIGRSFFEMNVLPFSDDAQDRFDQLRKERIRIGTMDLRIASVALVEGATVLTANSRDFEKVPELSIDDWTTRRACATAYGTVRCGELPIALDKSSYRSLARLTIFRDSLVDIRERYEVCFAKVNRLKVVAEHLSLYPTGFS